MFDKTICLLAKTCSVEDPKQLGHLSIGDRDAILLQLREWTFGSKLNNMTKCPHCNEVVEWQSNTNELYFQSIPSDLSIRTFEVEKDLFHIRFRLPDSFDMLNAISNKDGGKTVLETCILEVNNGECTTNDLDEAALMAVNERMAKEDPQANISINLNCPSCSNQWKAVFDIVSFFWLEINNWAKRMLHEVYLLARAFGWSEKDILAMSPYRRQLYIQMISR